MTAPTTRTEGAADGLPGTSDTFAGYAPGNYESRCLECYTGFIGDKRAFRCYRCACTALRKMNAAVAERDAAHPPQPVPVVATGAFPHTTTLLRILAAVHPLEIAEAGDENNVATFTCPTCGGEGNLASDEVAEYHGSPSEFPVGIVGIQTFGVGDGHRELEAAFRGLPAELSALLALAAPAPGAPAAQATVPAVFGEDHSCGGPAEACMQPGCPECGMRAPARGATLTTGAREVILRALADIEAQIEHGGEDPEPDAEELASIVAARAEVEAMARVGVRT